MIKYIALWVVKPGLDPDRIWKDWQEKHAPWVKERLAPDLKRYVQHRILEELPGAPVDFFGLTEFWFEDIESAKRAIARMTEPPLDDFMMTYAIPSKVRRVLAEEIEVEL